jgi:hypothetical protein
MTLKNRALKAGETKAMFLASEPRNSKQASNFIIPCVVLFAARSNHSLQIAAPVSPRRSVNTVTDMILSLG